MTGKAQLISCYKLKDLVVGFSIFNMSWGRLAKLMLKMAVDMDQNLAQEIRAVFLKPACDENAALVKLTWMKFCHVCHFEKVRAD